VSLRDQAPVGLHAGNDLWTGITQLTAGERNNSKVVNSALLLGLTGIVVSGVIGPGLAAYFAQNSQVSAFNRGQASERRSELRSVLDQAAVLLASGATNLRILQESHPDGDQLRDAKEWLTQIFPIGQRLQLWLPHDDPVVEAYEKVRKQLAAVGESGPTAEDQLQQFEADRRAFLDLSRAKLLAPITDVAGAE
jgi:hypothetical protein